MSDWQEEFPRLFRWRDPKVFFADVIVGWERRLRKFIYGVGLLMIGYVVWAFFREFFATGKPVNIFENKWLVWTFMSVRNYLYILTVIDMVFFSIPALLIYMKRKQHAKAVKTTFSLLWMVMFITFSFAIAGLVIDFVFVVVGFHMESMRNVGAPVGNDLVKFMLGK